MDVPTFVLELVRTVIWPATLVVLVILLRQPLRSLIPSLQRLRFKNKETEIRLDFGKGLGKAEAAAEESNLPPVEEPGQPPVVAQPPTSAPGPESGGEQSRLVTLALLSPAAAVTESWTRFEAAARAAIRRVGLPEPRNARELERSLREHILPHDAAATLLPEMRQLRNLAAHGEALDLGAAQAIEYGRLIERLIAALNESGRQQGDSDDPSRLR